MEVTTVDKSCGNVKAIGNTTSEFLVVALKAIVRLNSMFNLKNLALKLPIIGAIIAKHTYIGMIWYIIIKSLVIRYNLEAITDISTNAIIGTGNQLAVSLSFFKKLMLSNFCNSNAMIKGIKIKVINA